MSNQPEIPPTFQEIAANHGLEIIHRYAYRSFFVGSIDGPECFITYREYDFMHLTAEQLESDIEAAVANHEPTPLRIAIGSKQVSRYHRHTIYQE